MPAATVRPKVLAIVYDPRVRSEGDRSLVEVCGYHRPELLMQAYAADLAAASDGYVAYQVVRTVTVDAFPRKADGFTYDAETFLRCLRARGGWHEPDAVDYHAILDAFDVVDHVERGAVDEVWLFGPPYAGFWESTMAGNGAYFCNADPIPGVPCSRRFVVMGFNYERGVGEMLEDFGHRVESIMARVYGSWWAWGSWRGHAWDRFTLYDLVAPEEAACGNVHFAPNSERDYDWGNPRPVWSTCDDWLSYPRLTGRKRLVDCREWGGGDIRAHHLWWLAHLPRADGASGGVLNNWWTYVVDPNETP